MISKATLTKIAAALKIKLEDLENAQKAEAETDVAIEEGLTVYSAEEITQLKNNEYKSGKEKGVEMSIKEAKEKHGLDFQGKTIDGLIEAANKKAIADAKISPDQKVQELEAKLSNIQKSYSELETNFKSKEAEVSQIKDEAELSSFIPAPSKDGVQYSSKEIIHLMKANGYDFKREDGKLVPIKDGAPVLNKVSAPEEVKSVITGFMTERKFITQEQQIGGHGGGNKPPGGKASTLRELKEEFKAAGKSLLGEEFQKATEAAVKANPDFDMNS